MKFTTIDRYVGIFGFWFGRLLDTVIGLLIAGLLAVVFSQFIDRNFFPFWRDSPEEYVKIGLTWLCFIGVVRAFSANEHIRVTILQDSLPPWLVVWIDTFIDALLLVLLLILTVKCWQMVQAAQYQIVLGTDLSLAVPASGILVGIALMVPLTAWRIVRRIVLGSAEQEG
ncbi:TRAP transporter small permease [Shinella pollutisoli]|uniref:TRAP transporter small permease protein n=1 Tax=Shinella pollutisoli TaxID=2250594 RepID=A0ABV7DMK9_9HYPH|nr:TRAP transporter small permease [Shinella pollutisoli]